MTLRVVKSSITHWKHEVENNNDVIFPLFTLPIWI